MSETKCSVPVLLNAAADWLEVDPDRWTTNVWGRRKDGQEAIRTRAACQACGEGAIEIVAGMKTFSESGGAQPDVVMAAKGAVELYLRRIMAAPTIPAFNDRIATSGKQVADVFRATAAELTKGKGDV